LPSSNQQIAELEEQIHARSRNLDNPDELYFSVNDHDSPARLSQFLGSQWTGISTIEINRSLASSKELSVSKAKSDRFQPSVILPYPRGNSGSAGE